MYLVTYNIIPAIKKHVSNETCLKIYFDKISWDKSQTNVNKYLY